MQNLEIIGNLTADPELREVDGKAVCNFTVACDTFLGETRKRTDYFRVTAWRKLAESCGMEYDCGEGLLAFFGMYVFD